MVALRTVAATLGLVVAVLGGFVVFDELRHWGDPEATTVVVLDEDGATLGAVEVRVADTYRERFRGLSSTASLGPDEGMLFVHEDEGEYAYVMRRMAFPLDIVFVGADRRITAIHHAETEEPPYTRYRGRARWVLEVPHEWTTHHGVEVGDRIRIAWGPEAAPAG